MVITPSVSGVFHGHLGHQGDEDIVPPFVYKGTTYSQNWDAAGQALFAAGGAASAAAPAVVSAKHEETSKVEHGNCPATTTTTERVVVGVWHATGAYKNGKRKYVYITPSLKSAHHDKTKHSDDIPVYEDRTVTVASSSDTCSNATVTPSAAVTPPPANLVVEQPQPLVPTSAATPAPVGEFAGAETPRLPTQRRPPRRASPQVESSAQSPALRRRSRRPRPAARCPSPASRCGSPR